MKEEIKAKLNQAVNKKSQEEIPFNEEENVSNIKFLYLKKKYKIK